MFPLKKLARKELIHNMCSKIACTWNYSYLSQAIEN